MRLDPRQLLRRLHPGGTTVGTSVEVGRATIDRATFEDLLARAANGEFPGGRPVDCDEVDPPLDDSIRDRIAAIVDVAEQSGHDNVLVIAGDRPLVVDVVDRRVETELDDSEAPEELRPVDAAIRLAVPSDPSSAVPVDLPTGIVPAAIAHAILTGRGDTPLIHQNLTQEATDDAA